MSLLYFILTVVVSVSFGVFVGYMIMRSAFKE